MAENTAQCVFEYESATMSCRVGNSDVVECPVVFERAWAVKGDGRGVNKTFAFGLRYDVTTESQKPIQERVYQLFARKLTQTTYNDCKKKLNQQMVPLVLYTSTSANQKGLRVTDSDCFVKLVGDVFNKATVQHVSDVIGFGNIEMQGEILMLGPQKSESSIGWGIWGWNNL